LSIFVPPFANEPERGQGLGFVLLIAYATLAERALGKRGTRDELNAKIAAITANPAIMDAVIKWLH
jgi:hypothetical protein